MLVANGKCTIGRKVISSGIRLAPDHIDLPCGGADRAGYTKGSFLRSLAEIRHSAIVKSFGRRLAYESPRGTNPRCVARGLWRFEELRVARVTGVVFTWLPRTVAAAVLPAKQDTAAMPRVGQIGADVWDRRD
jgi:hypothetical protein